MSKFLFGMGLAVILALAAPISASAQTPYELNLHGGAFFLDNADDTDVMLGARILLHFPSGWGFGGNFDWVLSNTDLDDDGPGEDIDQNLYLYSGEITYAFPTTSQLEFFVSGGVGAATFKLSDIPEPLEDVIEDSSTNLLIPVGGGVRWYNRTSSPSWAIRGDVRDNIIFVDTFDTVEGDEDSKATNNFEVSGGVSFFF